MMISKDEWKTVAERAAAADYGTKHAGWYAFKRMYAVKVVIGTLGAGIGLGGYLVWRTVRPIFDQDAHWPSAGLPSAFWFIAVIALVATVIAFRPRPMPTLPHLLIIKVLAFGFAWLGLFGYAIARLAS